MKKAFISFITILSLNGMIFGQSMKMIVTQNDNP